MQACDTHTSTLCSSQERLQESMMDAERAHGNDMHRAQQPAAGVIKTEGR